MNKELFVSSTPHETKVGMVEDDLLAEIYLERENEYTLAGSIYKGRVTRVLPGMQSAFVDIGLERDAFLYVSDFMELEEHDEDVTDVVPADRGVQDMRPQPAQASAAQGIEGTDVGETAGTADALSGQEFEEGDEAANGQASVASAGSAGSSSGRDSQDRDRGGWRGRRRRRGGRRDGARWSRPRHRAACGLAGCREPTGTSSSRYSSSGAEKSQQFGPPAGYQPIILPGESISKYRGMAAPVAAPQPPEREDNEHEARGSQVRKFESELQVEAAAPIAATFPDDEPIFASSSAAGTELSAQPEVESDEDAQPDRRISRVGINFGGLEPRIPSPRCREREYSSYGPGFDRGRAGSCHEEHEPTSIPEISDEEITKATEQALPLRRLERWKKRPSTKKKRTRCATNNRPMRAMTSLKRRRGPPAS